MLEAVIMTLQLALIRLNYDIGRADGQFGPKTLAGLLAYLSGRAIDAQICDFATALLPELKGHGILNSILRLAHFLATLIKKSNGLTRFEEDLHYTTPKRLDAMFSNVKGLDHAARLIKAGPVAIGNCVYANHNGNGDEASGDGYRYRGRGPIQLTGRENYRRMAAALNLPLEIDPDLALRPDVGARIAGQFWADKSLWKWADRDDAAGVRYRVNGEAMEGLADCRPKP